eukprot:TRINITY_DN8653_c0_g1_i1.p1 TRINITY_DN8653_c0_g1~~TRINITY_DN8653_c0_g1_i1.p1  ORF type:complete len:327 (+),score=70.31 TRINITY_DN8653_c0_g1_i1:147-983(+)
MAGRAEVDGEEENDSSSAPSFDAGSKKGKGKGKRAPNAEHCLPSIDPQVDELCKKFGVKEDKIIRRLSDVMMTREDTYEADMRALWQVCEQAQKPSGSLVVKIQELEQGRFTGTEKLDQSMLNFRARWKLDDRAISLFVQVIHPRSEKKDDMRQLEKHLRDCTNPSQAIIPLLNSIQKIGRLDSPERKRDRSRENRRFYSRSRSRDRKKDGRKRSKSRSKKRSKSRSKNRSKESSEKRSKSRSRKRPETRSKKRSKSRSKKRSKSRSKGRKRKSRSRS